MSQDFDSAHFTGDPWSAEHFSLAEVPNPEKVADRKALAETIRKLVAEKSEKTEPPTPTFYLWWSSAFPIKPNTNQEA